MSLSSYLLSPRWFALLISACAKRTLRRSTTKVPIRREWDNNLPAHLVFVAGATNVMSFEPVSNAFCGASEVVVVLTC